MPKYLLVFVMLTILTGLGSYGQNRDGIGSKKKQSKSTQAYEVYIDKNEDAHLKEYFELASIPSISSMESKRPEVERAADWIVRKLQSLGFINARAIPTAGLPIVYGSWEYAKGAPTVLIYAHYDVQPVKESEWVSPPFNPKVENGKIFGRGVSDDKSGVLISIWAVEALLNTEKRLPVNIKFVFDGEEESGSPNFKDFLAANKEMLKADFALNGDGGQFNDSIPSMELSYRGGVQLEFSVKTADIDAHSGTYGGKTPNAVVAMSQIIASFFHPDGSVAVEGFYDKVLPLTEAEKEMVRKIPYDPSKDMKVLGTTTETGDTTYLPLERVWYRPTLEIVGMQGGYTSAEGFSNIIPGNAMARITCRLVENQSAKEIVDLIVKHINKNCPRGATVNYKFRPQSLRPFKLPLGNTASGYVADALAAVYGREVLVLGTGGSIGPLIDIKEQLGIIPYPLGFAQDDENAHGANEFFRLSSMRKGQIVYCYYLKHMADQELKRKK